MTHVTIGRSVEAQLMNLAEMSQTVARRFRALRVAWRRPGRKGIVILAVVSRLVPQRLLFVHDFDLVKLGELNVRVPAGLIEEYAFSTADASTLEELVECSDYPPSVDLRRKSLERVLDLCDSCITVRHRGRLIAYICTFAGHYDLTYDDYGPKTLTFALDENAIFLGNIFIRPEYRMKGLFPHIVRHCAERFPAGTRFFGHIDVHNIHSFNSHRRLGFVPLLTVTCLSIGPANLFFQRPFGTVRRTRVEHNVGLRLVETHGGGLALKIRAHS
jgi:hypothetical protein